MPREKILSVRRLKQLHKKFSSWETELSKYVPFIIVASAILGIATYIIRKTPQKIILFLDQTQSVSRYELLLIMLLVTCLSTIFTILTLIYVKKILPSVNNEKLIFQTQVQAVNEYVDNNNNTIQEVKIIQYSAATVIEQIKKILEDEKYLRVRLLLVDPFCLKENEDKADQLARICHSLSDLIRDHEEKNFNLAKLTIQMYDVPATIRGFNFDNIHVIIGWYIYFHNKTVIKIIGHDKPVISLPIQSEDGEKIKNLFNDAFKKLSDKSINITPLLENPEFKNPPIGRERCDILKDYIEIIPS